MASWNLFTAALAFMRADLEYLKLLRGHASYTDQDEPSVASPEWEEIIKAKRKKDELEKQMFAIWTDRNHEPKAPTPAPKKRRKKK